MTSPTLQDIASRFSMISLPADRLSPPDSPLSLGYPKTPISESHDHASIADSSSSISSPYAFEEGGNARSWIIDASSDSRTHIQRVSPHSTTECHSLNIADLVMTSFRNSRSRVVRLYDLPPSPSGFLSSVFLPHRGKVPIPITLWVLRDDYLGPRPMQDSVWAVYKDHEQAVSTLSLSGPLMSVAPALESDLEPFHKLRKFELFPVYHDSRPPSNPQFIPRLEPPRNTKSSEYTMSTNPPNPRSSFRAGDWICPSPKCAAHNFGRNWACIGCGQSRSPTLPQTALKPQPPPHALPSPRFVSSTSLSSPLSPSFGLPSQQSHQHPPSNMNAGNKQAPQHPLLTPSGRAFASGGKVQNVSSDPMIPCVMYWPENEPLPEQGQIRPTGLSGVQQPPILNTGNRGPIEHQPGDWICLKCNYLNWRRRKVCQTCFPYAEGNGDSISAAMQSERIALLTSALNQSQRQHLDPPSPTFARQMIRSQSLTPPQVQLPFVDKAPVRVRGPVRSQSHFDLGAQYANSSPIYQTSGFRQLSSHDDSGVRSHSFRQPLLAPAPLLPSFLQDIVQSPALSPASSSSPALSFEDYDEFLPPPPSMPASSGYSSKTKDMSSMQLSNIWRLDGHETRSLAAFALPNHHDLMGAESRKTSREMLRTTVIVN